MLTQQIVPPTGQQLTARAETVQSEKPWSELTHDSKRRRSDVTNNKNGVSVVNMPLAQAASQMPPSTAMQPGKLTQQVYLYQYQ